MDQNGSIDRPFSTINAALAAAAAGWLVYVYAGTYNETLAIPAGVAVRGASTLVTTIQQLNVLVDTDLVTFGENTRLEDVALRLTSLAHVDLRGLVFPGTTSLTAKWRGSTLTVDNSGAGGAGTSDVIGAQSTGIGTPDESVSAIRACTITVNSAGLGIKRGILVSAANAFHARDTNVRVTNAGGAGSYIGLEVNNAAGVLSARLASVTAPTADVSQTAGSLLLGAANLFNHTANGLGFSAVQQPSTLLWGDTGTLPAGVTQFLRPGMAGTTATEIRIRIPQGAILKSLSVRAQTGPGAARVDTFRIRRNGVNTLLTVTLTGAQVSNENDLVSEGFLPSDDVSLQFTSAAGSTTTEVLVTVDVF